MKVKKTLEQRFKEKFIKLNSGSCWIWQGAKQSYGHGLFRVGGRKGKLERAHRVAWELTYGPVPDGVWVLHKCDNGACVNPDHLYLGDHKKNMQDMVDKGRSKLCGPKGENSHLHKLTAKDVLAIRASFTSGVMLANQYGVTKANISAIRNRKSWRSL